MKATRCGASALLMALLVAVPNLHAWGKQGHAIVASTAARLLALRSGRAHLRTHEYDLGYYSNVPDVIWRNLSTEIGQIEAPEHYFDWTDELAEEFGTPADLPLQFEEYRRRLGERFDPRLGFAPWRIQELASRCRRLAEHLSKEKQGPLLVCLGTLSHYSGDLAQPLHTSENHDGQLTNQPGIHIYFESELVTELDPGMRVEVQDRALRRYDAARESAHSGEQALRQLIAESHSLVPELLQIDRSVGRDDRTEASRGFRDLIIDRLAAGAATTALIWEEILADSPAFDEKGFYFFEGRPEYIAPGYRGL